MNNGLILDCKDVSIIEIAGYPGIIVKKEGFEAIHAKKIIKEDEKKYDSKKRYFPYV